MNDNIQGIPYSTAEFDKEGKPRSQPTVPAGTTDLIVISHGWNNDRHDAEAALHETLREFRRCHGRRPRDQTTQNRHHRRHLAIQEIRRIHDAADRGHQSRRRRRVGR